jgi:plastocyanin
MRKALVTVLTTALLGALAVEATGQDRRTVRVGDNYFVRDSSRTPRVTVDKGTRVVWRWRGDNAHNVYVTDGPSEFASDTQRSGRYSKKMRRAGTYRIVCTIHSGMRMTLRVRR